MSVTIWSTPASAIATRTEIIGWTEPEGAAAPEPIYSDPVLLERIAPPGPPVLGAKRSAWARPQWTPEQRADPASYGADNFKAGERILDVVDVKPSLGQYDRLGAMGEGVPDLDLGRMTYTWAKISAAAFDPATHHAPVWDGSAWSAPSAKSQSEIDAELAAAISAKSTSIEAERSRRIYLPIGPVDVRGDGTLMVEPDIRHARDGANLDRLSLRCTQLSLAGVTTAVVPFGDAANVQQMLTPAEMVTLAAAPFTRASNLFVKARTLKTALNGMTAAQVAAFDPTDDANWAG